MKITLSNSEIDVTDEQRLRDDCIHIINRVVTPIRTFRYNELQNQNRFCDAIDKFAALKVRYEGYKLTDQIKSLRDMDLQSLVSFTERIGGNSYSVSASLLSGQRQPLNVPSDFRGVDSVEITATNDYPIEDTLDSLDGQSLNEYAGQELCPGFNTIISSRMLITYSNEIRQSTSVKPTLPPRQYPQKYCIELSGDSDDVEYITNPGNSSIFMMADNEDEGNEVSCRIITVKEVDYTVNRLMFILENPFDMSRCSPAEVEALSAFFGYVYLHSAYNKEYIMKTYDDGRIRFKDLGYKGRDNIEYNFDILHSVSGMMRLICPVIMNRNRRVDIPTISASMTSVAPFGILEIQEDGTIRLGMNASQRFSRLLPGIASACQSFASLLFPQYPQELLAGTHLRFWIGYRGDVLFAEDDVRALERMTPNFI